MWRKIFEVIVFMKIYITAQAQQKHYLAQSVQDSAIVIIEHLLKLTIMPNNTARNHWQGEIAGHLKHVQMLKNTKKLPTRNELIKWTYTENLDFIKNKAWILSEIDNIFDEYGYEYDGDINTLMENFNDICYEYFSWLSSKLSTDGVVRNRDIYKKLDELV